MRTVFHIGPDAWVSMRLQDILHENRALLTKERVLFPRASGRKNHTRAFMAVSPRVDTLRFHRGYASEAAQQQLRDDVMKGLASECAAAAPNLMILSAHQFGTHLTSATALEALRDMVAALSDDIQIVAHIEAPSEMLMRHYALQVLEGRARSLDLEYRFLADTARWWDKACASAPHEDPMAGIFPDVQMAPAFIDLKSWVALWESVFGKGNVHLRRIDRDMIRSEAASREIAAAFGMDFTPAKIARVRAPAHLSAEWAARACAFNDLLLRRLRQRDIVVPRQEWRRMLSEMRVDGPPLNPKDIAQVDQFFQRDLRGLSDDHKAIRELLLPKRESPDWPSAPIFTAGFRASQYLLANIDGFEQRQGTSQVAEAEGGPQSAIAQSEDIDTPTHLPASVQRNYANLIASSFAPHNRMGSTLEEIPEEPYAPREAQVLPGERSGNVIVGCMKNEAPYILEWVAYHRAIGVDQFLIYTNGCEDGTTEILGRLQSMGVLQHRDNTAWKGKSPQQHALNQAVTEPVIRNADWVIHIDVDEFINVRCGNGTLHDFFTQVPNATNVAMTWRLFGHNGVTTLSDALVIEQFDTCAPKFCPKPHTAWGFKTMFRNIGAYEKISCHRPNKLIPGREMDVNWVNGSGKPMGEAIKTKGWRNSKTSIGYDLLQLNHYALRSAESFLIKRQRGRALHVDRSIGLNYWIRMDWSNFRDVTIMRNVPRVRAERDRLLKDPTLRRWHDKGLAWHRQKADELHQIPEFEELYQQALAMKLTETERAAYALALDMES